jgi:hypothetical protein
MAAADALQDANEVNVAIEEIVEISNLKEHTDLQNQVDEEDHPEPVKEARTKLQAKEEAGKKI